MAGTCSVGVCTDQHLIARSGYVLVLACSVGIVIGGLSGYAGGKIDNIMMRLTTCSWLFGSRAGPGHRGCIGRQPDHAMIAVTVAWWPCMPAGQRSVLSVKNNLYVRPPGFWRKRCAHPGAPCAAQLRLPILVMLSMDVGFVILMTASLSFLGLGPKPPRRSWGP